MSENALRDKFWYLQQVNLFEGIPEKEIMNIAKNVHDKSINKKELVYTPFEASDCVYILKKGEVTLYNSKDGKKLIIDVLKPGSFFGNISFKEEKNTHFAEVTEDAYICIFHLDEFIAVLQSRQDLMMKFITLMSEKIADYETRLQTGLLDAKDKVIEHIKILNSKDTGSLLQKLSGFKSKITHEQLAQHTGLTRETVTRALTELKKEGRIKVSEKGKIKVL